MQSVSMKGIPTSFAWQLLSGSARNFMDDRALRLAAALAYYSVFAIAPLLLISVAVASFFYRDQALSDQMSEQLRGYMGKPAADAVQEVVKGASLQGRGTGAMIIGIVTILVGASGFFAQLKDALNTVWQVEAKPGCALKELIRDRLLSFALVLAVGGLLLFSLAASTVMAGVSAYTERLFDLPDFVWSSLNALISMSVSTLLFALIFKFLPDARVPWRTVLAGALLTAALFEIGKLGLAFYLGRESTTSGFGAAGSLILILLWAYYASAILLFGAEMTQVWARLRNVPVTLTAFGIRMRPVPERYTIRDSTAT